MFFSSGRIHPVVLFVVAIFAAYLAVFLLAAFPEHDHDEQCHDQHQCTVCAWFNSLTVVLPGILAVQLCFLYFRQLFPSCRAPRISFLLPVGRAPPAS